MNRLVNVDRKYGMEININKSQAPRVSIGNESLRVSVANREISLIKLNTLKVNISQVNLERGNFNWNKIKFT